MLFIVIVFMGFLTFQSTFRTFCSCFVLHVFLTYFHFSPFHFPCFHLLIMFSENFQYFFILVIIVHPCFSLFICQSLFIFYSYSFICVHLITLSPYHLIMFLTFSYFHLYLWLLHLIFFTLSSYHPIALTPYRLVALSPFHLFTFSKLQEIPLPHRSGAALPQRCAELRRRAQ